MTDEELRALVKAMEKRADDRAYGFMVYLAVIPIVWLAIFGVAFVLYQHYVATRL